MRRVAATLAAIVLLAGVAAAGIGIGRLTSSHTSQPTASEAIPPPASTSGTVVGGKLNIAKIAAWVDPAIVDMTSVLSAGGGAAGTGMVLTPNGEVLTNNHVVEGATSISAQLDGKGQRYVVKVLGVDVTSDIALVQLVGASGLPTVAPGNSTTLSVGQQVVAIGNALALPGSPTVTNGIISALNRSINAADSTGSSTEHLTGMIQTSAPINPGNSGGALVDVSGRVIGMNTAAANGDATSSATNIGFAIPINTALGIASQIQQGHGSATIEIGQRGYIGVEVQSVAVAERTDLGAALGLGGIFPGGSTYTAPVKSGAVVAATVSGGAAAGAGIVRGDVITGLNGHAVTTPSSLSGYLSNEHPGAKVSVTWVDSAGRRHTATVTLQAGPVA
jgi:S1-C subfamily serine protease